jgi:transcriptional regulator with XRE-family HTH domain
MITKLNNQLSDVLLSIGKRVKESRTEKELTQQDLAFYSNTERSTISRIERFNFENISIKTLLKIAIVLEMNLQDFFLT